jgi:sugar phosphate isomerase/epimerase
MLISIATATLYFFPFEQAVQTIAEAGFNHVELDFYWEGGESAMAQHLKGWSPREAVQLIHRAGLHVASIHDTGGVLDDANSCRGFISPQLMEYVDQLGYAPDCIVLHTPHIEGDYDERWWQAISGEIVKAAEEYRQDGTAITIENMPLFPGYYVPLTKPDEMLAFVSENDLGVTLDTTHYAQIGIDITEAASVLREKVKTIHLGDYLDGSSHVFIGDGGLDFAGFFGALDLSSLHSVTLECSPAFLGEDASRLTEAEITGRLKIARQRLSALIPGASRMEEE